MSSAPLIEGARTTQTDPPVSQQELREQEQRFQAIDKSLTEARQAVLRVRRDVSCSAQAEAEITRGTITWCVC